MKKKATDVQKNLSKEELTNLIILLMKGAGLNQKLIADGIVGKEALEAAIKRDRAEYGTPEWSCSMALSYVIASLSFDVIGCSSEEFVSNALKSLK